MKYVAFLFILLTMTAYPDSGFKLSLQKRGKEIQRFSLAQMRQKIPSQQIEIWEPHEGKEVIYIGLAMNDILNLAFENKWQNEEEIVFTCQDGYQSSIPVERFQTFKAFLVFARLDQKNFTVNNPWQGESNVALGPFYLIWDNLKSPQLRAQGAQGWPYQVVALDLVRLADKFARMTPPDNAIPSVKAGFLSFRNKCSSCHTINGVGGSKGLELNYPTNVTEYLSDYWMTKRILDSRSIRYNSTMPAFKDMPEKGIFIADVIAYLKAMSQKKIKPQ